MSPESHAPHKVVVKIGGSTLGAHDTTLQDLVTLQRQGTIPVVVHGGGAVVTQWLEKQGVPTRFVRGLRVTDAESLQVVTAVLAGLVNKELVAGLLGFGGKAVGISGIDGAVPGLVHEVVVGGGHDLRQRQSLAADLHQDDVPGAQLERRAPSNCGLAHDPVLDLNVVDLPERDELDGAQPEAEDPLLEAHRLLARLDDGVGADQGVDEAHAGERRQDEAGDEQRRQGTHGQAVGEQGDDGDLDYITCSECHEWWEPTAKDKKLLGY